MNIIQKNNYFLIIKYLPLYKYIGLFLSISSLVTIFLLETIMFTSAHLSCNKESREFINCKLEYLSTFINKRSINILNPIKAKLIEERPKGNPLYNILIITKSNNFTFLMNLGNSDYKLSQDITFKINNFIDNPNQNHLSLKYEGLAGLTFQRLFLLSLIIIGIYWRFITKVVIYSFDKNLKTISIETNNIFGTKITQYSYSKILDINIEKNTTNHINVNPYNNRYRLVFILTDTKKVPFTQDYPLSKIYAIYIANNVLNFIKS